MIYKIYVRNAGVPVEGLSLSWRNNVLKKVADGSVYDADPDTSYPFTEITMLGFYIVDIVPTEEIVGVIDCGASIPDVDRYPPFSATPYDNMAELLMRAAVTGKVVADASNSATAFKTDLPGIYNKQYEDAYLRMDGSPLVGQVRKILSFDKNTQVITLEKALVDVPSAGMGIKVINGL